MISFQLDNKEIEKTLYSQFESSDKIKDYLYELIIEDLEEKRFGKLIQDEHKKEYVDKSEIFKVLNNIK